MARVGRLAVDIGLGVDQLSGSLAVIDGQQLTRVTKHHDLTNDATILIPDSYVLEASFRYGRDRFIHGDFETGTGTIVLNNDTGEWSPNSGVNGIGGDKLRPGMIVHIGYTVSGDQLEIWLTANTPYTWALSGTGEADRSVPNAETWTGFVDGCTWTNHGADNDVTVNPMKHPVFLNAFSTYPRFSGRIWSIEDQYEEGGRGSVTVVQLVDYMADMAQINPGALSVARSAENINTRVQFGIYPELNTTDQWLGAFLTPNIYQVEASDLPNNYLEELRVAARAAGGDIFAYHTYYGQIAFMNSNWIINRRNGAVVQATIGNGRIGIVNASTEYSISRVFNKLIYSNSTTEATVTDAASVATYSTRTLRRTILNNDATDLAALAARDLAMLKDAKLIIKQVTIRPETLFEVAFAMRVECGDLIDVTIENNGWEYTQQLHVAGISGRWSAASDDWEISLRLDSREGDTVLT